MVKDRDARSPWGRKQSDMTEPLNNKNNRQKTPGFLALPATTHPTPSPTANSTGFTLKTPPESDISHPTLLSKPPAPPQSECRGLFSLLSLPPPAPYPNSSRTDDGRTRSSSQPSSAPPPPLSSVHHRLPTNSEKTSPLPSSHTLFLSLGWVSHTCLPAGSRPPGPLLLPLLCLEQP